MPAANAPRNSWIVAISPHKGEGARLLHLARALEEGYDTAAHECDLLRGILAKDCRLETINVNVNANGGRQFNQQQQEGFNLSGSMSLQITLK